MKKAAFPFVLLTLLLVSGSAFGQSPEEKIRLHIAPFNFFDPVTGVLQVGAQKNFSQRFALSLDHGFRMQTFRKLLSDGESDRKNYKYSKTKAELKYFVGKGNPVTSSYLSMEAMYFPQSYRKENAYLIRNEQHYRYTTSQIDRTVWVTSLKYGIEVRFSSFVLDHFFGLGLRRLSIAHQPSDLQEAEFYEETDVWFPPLDRNEGVFYRPHVAMGLKVGYILK
ncbi:hypothetical protein [Pontibacter ramchanderi]|uniref:DUF3575 domain-containing protein n=1 Tax=Pontibacter ramchanderi TaxID=1179743 RepID=A0A2N3U991_9BACT|nr:hypothetical protein [Pontibacter ramchanderi]PKV63312.1 hypothetical protein BD749_3152 [Pontibacter ramchanderi]